MSVITAASAARLGLATFSVAMALAATALPAAAQDGAMPAAVPVATDDAAKFAKGKDVFANYGCGGCHTLADAGASGHVGPAFDGNANLSHDLVVDRVTNGSGPMPAFGGQMSAEEIEAISAYVIHAAQK